jgi:Na+-transporting methylmalonyl-CoA/oxaloacetate decarboxylase beta subunit
MVDNIVIMDTCDNIGRSIVLPVVLQPLCNLVWLIPATLPALGLLELCNFAQERNVTGGKEVKSSVDINNPLPRLRSLSVDQRLEQASLLDFVVHLRGA